MADPTLIEQIEAVLLKGKEEHRTSLPHATVAQKACGLHQVECVIARPTGIEIVINLRNAERDLSTDKVKDLDKAFARYANDSECWSEKWRRILTFVNPKGDAWWPLRYTLSPTYTAEDLESVALADARTKTIEEMHEQEPRPKQIILSWALIEEALTSGQYVDRTASCDDRHANMYQAVKDAEGASALWVATLPRRDERQSPNRDGRLKVSTSQGGVVVQLTARWVIYLQRFMERDGVAKDCNDWTDAYFARKNV